MNRSASPSSSKSRAQEDSSPFLDARTDLFLYFATQLGERDWSDKDVLDFGGNIGSLLRDPDSTIQEQRYWCIDIIPEAIEQGRRDYPRAHWLFYDQYNFFFNPHGIKDLDIPDPGQPFDIIAAYSVFTNNLESDMLRLVARLERMLKPGGRLAFTFTDPHPLWPGQYRVNNLQWRLERIRQEGIDIDVQALAQQAQGAQWCILLNDRELYVDTHDLPTYAPELQKSCYVYHSAAYMQSLFPRATILSPACGEMQHCCVLQRAQVSE